MQQPEALGGLSHSGRNRSPRIRAGRRIHPDGKSQRCKRRAACAEVGRHVHRQRSSRRYYGRRRRPLRQRHPRPLATSPDVRRPRARRCSRAACQQRQHVVHRASDEPPVAAARRRQHAGRRDPRRARARAVGHGVERSHRTHQLRHERRRRAAVHFLCQRLPRHVRGARPDDARSRGVSSRRASRTTKCCSAISASTTWRVCMCRSPSRRGPTSCLRMRADYTVTLPAQACVSIYLSVSVQVVSETPDAPSAGASSPTHPLSEAHMSQIDTERPRGRPGGVCAALVDAHLVTRERRLRDRARARAIRFLQCVDRPRSPRGPQRPVDHRPRDRPVSVAGNTSVVLHRCSAAMR